MTTIVNFMLRYFTTTLKHWRQGDDSDPPLELPVMYITVGNCQLLFEFTEKLAPGQELPTPTSDTSMFISNCPPKPLLWGWAAPLILWRGGGEEKSPREGRQPRSENVISEKAHHFQHRLTAVYTMV